MEAKYLMIYIQSNTPVDTFRLMHLCNNNKLFLGIHLRHVPHVSTAFFQKSLKKVHR